MRIQENCHSKKQNKQSPSEISVIYDGNCGICKNLVDWASKRIRYEIKFIPSQSLKPETYGLTQKDFDDYVWLIRSEKKHAKGGTAASEVLRLMNPGWRLIGSILLMPPFSFFASFVYNLISKNRHRFSNACSMP